MSKRFQIEAESKPTNMSIFLTGSSGFIGSALSKKLLSDNFIVYTKMHSNRFSDCVINLTSDSEPEQAKPLSDALKNCQVFFHLAARAHILKETESDPLSVFRQANVNETLRFAQIAADAGVKRFVFLSSIGVNGLYSSDKPFTESDTTNPHNPYTTSKFEAEELLRKLEQKSNMEVVIIRSPIVYGPKLKANFLNLFKIVDMGLPLPFGSIQNRRSIIYVGNLVDALIRCATHPAAAGQTFIVSDNEVVSTPQLVRAIGRAIRRPSLIFPLPLPIMQVCAGLVGKSSVIDRLTQSLEVNSSKMRRELGWEPPYTMQQGLEATAEWFAESKKIMNAD